MIDWRGTEINVGDTVVYGAGVGRSISPTVATVIALRPKVEQSAYYPEDKVKLEVQEYAYGLRGSWTEKDRFKPKPVYVMAARVTVVSSLPEATRICPNCKMAFRAGADSCGMCERYKEQKNE